MKLGGWKRACLVTCGVAAALTAGCNGGDPKPRATPASGPAAPRPAAAPPAISPARQPHPALPPDHSYYYRGANAEAMTREAARAAGLMTVDLGDEWAPFLFQDTGGPGDPAKPNGYRGTFVALGNERLNVDGVAPRAGEHHYLEVFGIPPTLSVLAARIAEDQRPQRRACFDRVDVEALRTFTGNIGYLDRERAKREYQEALQDAVWLDRETAARIPFSREGAIALMRAEPKLRGRVDRTLRGQERLRAVRAAQARLVCEGLLSDGGRSRFVDGMFDLLTHEALAIWERKNDIFGWGFLGGETAAALVRPPLELHFDAFKRVLAERVSDAGGLLEDGSIGKSKKTLPTFKDEAGAEQTVPNLIADFVGALLAAADISSPEAMMAFLQSHGQDGLKVLKVAYAAPPLPPYYGPNMDLSVEIDRGDVWYDFPFDKQGKPVLQNRDHYPHLTVSVNWRGQTIPLAWWRTTIGSWRSEVDATGQVFMRYKNSDVGPRVWRTIIAGPAWVPPDSTPAKDLLTRKVLDRMVGPVNVVNTDVIGPGFQSAYGLVMAIHADPRRGGFDNQIRTHGSVDYTSIARRFSHGCHRLVNNRAVRLFNFVLRHRSFQRVGNLPLNLKRQFTVDGQAYAYQIKTRGYSYELVRPIPVSVTEGRVVGQVKQAIAGYMRKPGVAYPALSSSDASTSITPKLEAPADPPSTGEREQERAAD
ncbi:MAG TPA: hypothetical protein VFH73_21120 [Polyangia bacterium]|nr:hypothetical protein [Polyangia bacterium]